MWVSHQNILKDGLSVGHAVDNGVGSHGIHHAPLHHNGFHGPHHAPHHPVHHAPRHVAHGVHHVPIFHQAPVHHAPLVHHAAPVHHAPAVVHHEQGPANYNYGYAVADSYSGVNFGATEARDGYATTGSYNVLLPDGRTQTVTYSVGDDYSGYVADVQYSGEPAPYAAAPAPHA